MTTSEDKDQARCDLATGGVGQLFHEQLDAIGHFDPFLTQKGLQIWWEGSRS